MDPRLKKQADDEVKIIRILSTDIRGDKKIGIALTKIKGISFSMANAVCVKLNLDKNKKTQDLGEAEIKRIETFLKDIKVPTFLLNRKNDPETGKDEHLLSNDLDFRCEFDIKRMKKIKCYKGFRHSAGQPVRGQRTKSHFRVNRRKSTGVKSKLKK